MNATFGTARVLHVKTDISVHAAANNVDRIVSNAQTFIPVRNANLDFGEHTVRRSVAVAV